MKMLLTKNGQLALSEETHAVLQQRTVYPIQIIENSWNQIHTVTTQFLSDIDWSMQPLS